MLGRGCRSSVGTPPQYPTRFLVSIGSYACSCHRKRREVAKRAKSARVASRSGCPAGFTEEACRLCSGKGLH